MRFVDPRGVFAILALGLMPALMVWGIGAARIPVPANALHSDPDWYYLGNSALVAIGRKAEFMDHPGIPLYALGALPLRAKADFFPEGAGNDLASDLFLHSADYHRFLGSIALCLNAIALFAFGLIVNKYYVPLWLAISSQALFLWAPMQIHFFARWMPEGLSVLFGVLYGLCFLGSAVACRSVKASAGVGAFLGVLLSVKLSFSPYSVLAFARSGRHALVFLFSAFLAFMAMLYPIGFDRTSILMEYFFALALKSGKYASGDVGFPGLSQMADNFAEFANEHAMAYAQFWWMLGISVVVFLLSRRWKVPQLRRMALVGLGTVVLSFVIQSKQPAARYALPLFVFFPTYLILFWMGERIRVARALVVALVLGALVHGAGGAWKEFRVLRLTASVLHKQESEIENLFAAKPECVHLFDDGASSFRWANFTADVATRGVFTPRLKELFPNAWGYDFGSQRFYSFRHVDADRFDFNDELRRWPCALFYSRKDIPEPLIPSLPKRRWVKIYEGARADIFYSESANK